MLKRPLCFICMLLMGILWCIRLCGGEDLFLKPAAWAGEILSEESTEVIGEFVEQRETANGFRLRIARARLKENRRPIGDLYVYMKEAVLQPPGTKMILAGRLSAVEGARNPGEFDTAWFYACDRIYYQMFKARIMDYSLEYSRFKAFAAALRGRLTAILAERGEEGAILSAMLLGDKSGLSQETRLRYQMAGIIAILAISGLHISVIGVGLNGLLEKMGLPPVPAFLVSLACLLFYLVLTGESVSAIRAVSMFMLNRMAFLLGRSYDLYTALAVSALWILLQAPACLFSCGFLLSFTAVIGIAAVTPVLEALFSFSTKAGNQRRGQKVKGTLLKGGMSSAAVLLATMPVSLYFYGEVSLIGILVNLLLLPSVGLVMGSGILGILLELAGLGGGANLVFLPAEGLLKLYDRVCALAVRCPGGVWICGSPSLYKCIGYYLILLLLCFLMKEPVRAFGSFRKEMDKRLSGIRLSGLPLPENVHLKKGAAVVLLIICLGLMGVHPVRKTEMTFLDVGQGDGIVVQTASASFLIDGGSSTEAEVGRYRILPFLKHQGISRLDGVFVTHTDMDHYSGILEILEMIRDGQTALKIDRVFLPDWKNTDGEWEELALLAGEAGAQVIRMHRGDRLESGKTTMTCLWPAAGLCCEDANEGCIVLKMSCGSFDAILTGDAGLDTEGRLLEDLAEADVLKVGHHGSAGSTGEAFLEKVRPKVSVISCARVNSYGHPAPETLQRLTKSGTRILYTMESGAITIRTDGKILQIRGYIGPVDKPDGNG